VPLRHAVLLDHQREPDRGFVGEVGAKVTRNGSPAVADAARAHVADRSAMLSLTVTRWYVDRSTRLTFEAVAGPLLVRPTDEFDGLAGVMTPSPLPSVVAVEFIVHNGGLKRNIRGRRRPRPVMPAS